MEQDTSQLWSSLAAWSIGDKQQKGLNTKESTYRFGEFAARLHDAQAQGDNFCCQQKIYHFLLISFHQGPLKEKQNPKPINDKLFPKNLTFQRGPLLCPPQESLSLNGRQSNCHPKYAAAHGWRRNRFDGMKVIKLGLGLVCFSERGCILGSPSVVTQTQEDHASQQQPLGMRNAF